MKGRSLKIQPQWPQKMARANVLIKKPNVLRSEECFNPRNYLH